MLSIFGGFGCGAAIVGFFWLFSRNSRAMHARKKGPSAGAIG
jgi:hypothetical protein